MSAYRVLLVDDDAFFLRVHADYLASHGIEVETAPSGEVALSLFSNKTFDLLIADLVMPGISGFELVDAMRSRVPSQDIVIITSTEDVKTAVRAMHLGVYDYLVKPVESEALLRVIDSLRNRPELYDDHARLVRENTQHLALQSVFEKALLIMDSLDLEVVVEKILETLADVCGAQAAALWTSPGEDGEYSLHGYRGLVDPFKQTILYFLSLASFASEISESTFDFVNIDLPDNIYGPANKASRLRFGVIVIPDMMTSILPSLSAPISSENGISTNFNSTPIL